MTKNPAAVELGTKGGKVKSDRKRAACIANAKKPRGMWVTAIAYEYKSTTGEIRFGSVLYKGKPSRKDNTFSAWVEAQILEGIGNHNHPIAEILQLATSSRLV